MKQHLKLDNIKLIAIPKHRLRYWLEKLRDTLPEYKEASDYHIDSLTRRYEVQEYRSNNFFYVNREYVDREYVSEYMDILKEPLHGLYTGDYYLESSCMEVSKYLNLRKNNIRTLLLYKKHIKKKEGKVTDYDIP